MFAIVIGLLMTFVVRCEQTYCNLHVFGCVVVCINVALPQTIVKQIEREETESG